MFRDLKEYQSLQKLYEEKVSKVENINSELNTKINYAIQQLELFQKEFLVD